MNVAQGFNGHLLASESGPEGWDDEILYSQLNLGRKMGDGGTNCSCRIRKKLTDYTGKMHR